MMMMVMMMIEKYKLLENLNKKSQHSESERRHITIHPEKKGKKWFSATSNLVQKMEREIRPHQL